MIKNDKIKKCRDGFAKNKENLVKQRIFYKTPLVDLISSEEFEKKELFDLELNIGNQYNQNHTGRCWCFAAARILNKAISDKLGDPNFEISINYLTFYDKLEKFNILMNRFRKKAKDCYDREISETLLKGIEDGGYFTWFANLVDKYGVVPKNCFPDSYQSGNSNEINNILSRLLRKFYTEVNSSNFEEVRDQYLEKAYDILSLVYGLPPTEFSYEYIDNNKEKQKLSNIKPQSLYNDYSNIDLLEDFVEVISYKDDKYKYNGVYEIEGLTNIEEYSNARFLDLKPERQKELIVAQLKDNEPVCFYSYVTKKQISGIFTDIYDRYSKLFGLDLNISKNDILLTNETKNGHAMIISGFKLENDIPVKWKILNSWPEKEKDVKYYVADNSWLDKYMSCVIVNKKYLEKKELEILNEKPVIISFWDNKIN